MSDNLPGLLEQARTHLVTFSDQLGEIFRKVDYYNEFSKGDAIADDKKQQALVDLFGIQFTHTSGVTAEWSLDRVTNAYQAVQNIVKKLGGEDSLANTFLFMQLFGSLIFELSGKDPKGTGAFASTSTDGNIIYLYTEETSSAHTAKNIVHEFGHVLVFRYGGNNSGIYQQWERDFWRFINDFDTTLGWTRTGFGQLENRLTFEDLRAGKTTSTELENERIANMFETWISGAESRLDLNSLDPKQKRAAWAMWSFMTGRCPPDDVKINLEVGVEQPPCGDDVGFLHWIRQYGG